MNLVARGFAALLTLVIANSMTNVVDTCKAFVPMLSTQSVPSDLRWSCFRKPVRLHLQKGWFAEDGEDRDEDMLVTREDLNRDLLGMEPKVKRKRKNGKGQGYRPLDNRDHLPFSVRTKTPDDPYKTEFQRRKEQQMIDKSNGDKVKGTDLDRHMLASTSGNSFSKRKNEKINSKSKKKLSDDSTTPSKLIQRQSRKKSKSQNGKSTTTVVGEFQLDKSTTSGDIIVIGDKEYLVETARCQYKYAGGQRFVMVRKILEVKELARAKKEDDLLRQYESSPSAFTSLSNDFE